MLDELGKGPGAFLRVWMADKVRGSAACADGDLEIESCDFDFFAWGWIPWDQGRLVVAWAELRPVAFDHFRLERIPLPGVKGVNALGAEDGMVFVEITEPLHGRERPHRAA